MMDNLESVTDNANLQSAASIVASLASATPITSEIVTDAFGTDPKFEITTLEKASYEDMYMDSLDHSNSMPLCDNVSLGDDDSKSDIKQSEESQKDTRTSGLLLKQSKAKPKEVKEPTKINSPTSDSEVQDVLNTIIDQEKSSSSEKEGCKPEVQVSSLQDLEGTSTHEQGKINDNNEANPHLSTEQMTKDEPNLQSSQSVKSIEIGETKELEHCASITTETPESSSIAGQASVDAQMEKVIENIVELSGEHQFPQPLGQDRDKVLESIRLEISSDRTSIDLMADVASKTQSLTTLTKNEETTSEVVHQDSGKTQTESHVGATVSDVEQPRTTPERQQPNDLLDKESDESVALSPSEQVEEAQKHGESIVSIDESQKTTEAQTVDESKERAESVETRLVEKTDIEQEPSEEQPLLSEPTGRRSLRVRTAKRSLEEESPVAEPPKKQVRRSRATSDEQNKSFEATKITPSIKLPHKTRQTISVSDPSARPASIRETRTSQQPVSSQTDKRYICQECGFATDRLNNLVYHTKTFCRGKLQIGEEMKANITRQQQQAKGRRRR